MRRTFIIGNWNLPGLGIDYEPVWERLDQRVQTLDRLP
jgi:hypothetical protein